MNDRIDIDATLFDQLARDRAELIEALRYWLPATEPFVGMTDPIIKQHIERWHECSALLSRLEKDRT